MLHQGQLCSFWLLLVTVLFEQLFQTPKNESRGELKLNKYLKTGHCPQHLFIKDVYLNCLIPFFSSQS